jgi:Domain of unknown function (DUF6431)/Homeodomain-like domain
VSASVMISEDEVEAWLAAGEVRCPGCGGSLAPWGWAREREVRLLGGRRSLRPRRACCKPCRTTHVLLPSWSVPRRRDGAEVIGRALVLKADGLGHRRIAERLGRPPGTVRGWLRAAAGRAEALHRCGVLWTVALGEELARPGRPRSPLQHAVEALGRAAIAWRLRFYDPRAAPWETIVGLTGGLLHGRPRDPPGYWA